MIPVNPSENRSPARRSPLTDPRALFGSATFHVALLVVVALAAVGAALPRSEPLRPRVLQAEIGPVDNRAPAESGGGAPGELGGDGQAPTVAIRAEMPDEAPANSASATAEAILSDVLPDAPAFQLAPAPGALPGPTTSGLGLLTGPGAGGGGGSGGGAGGGIGRGIGPSTEFFGAREQAVSFAYVIDCSGSMINNSSLDLAKRELLASLGQLPPDAKFAVIFYNLDPTIFPDASGRPGLMPATADNKDRVRTRLSTIQPDGGTRSRVALEAAIGFHPEVIYLLTDGQELTYDDARVLHDQLDDSRVHVIEFGGGPPPVGGRSPLQELAGGSGGTYRHVNVRTYREGRAP